MYTQFMYLLENEREKSNTKNKNYAASRIKNVSEIHLLKHNVLSRP